MTETLWNEIVKLAPLWWIIAVVIIGISMRFYYARFKKLEEKTVDSNCKIHDYRIGVQEESGKDHGKRITKIELLLAKRGASFASDLIETKSPRKLNEKGIELYEISGGKQLIEENADHFIGLINKRSPKTALDVQILANMVLYDEMDSDMFIPVKNYIYNNPKFNEEDIDLQTVCVVMSYPLRNLYLDRHPELLPNQQ